MPQPLRISASIFFNLGCCFESDVVSTVVGEAVLIAVDVVDTVVVEAVIVAVDGVERSSNLILAFRRKTFLDGIIYSIIPFFEKQCDQIGLFSKGAGDKIVFQK